METVLEDGKITLRVDDVFWNKLELVGDCFVWTGCKNNGGYGCVIRQVNGKRKTLRIHRLAYEHFYGTIPEGLVPDHLCRNRACANPEHIELVTNYENIRRGMGYTAKNARKTHCCRGHEFTEDNTYFNYKNRFPRRQCRHCGRIKDRARRAKQRELLKAVPLSIIEQEER